jgi:thiamine-phosphate pyrophosphorylase
MFTENQRMKKISRLHYITQEVPGKSHWELADEACQGGVQWVQLRIKNKSYDEWMDVAVKTLAVCRKYGSKLIINDNVDIAKESKADGVHLGKTDMDVSVARKVLGEDVIIGGTANTFDDIKKLAGKRVDYIGLGPFRFTTTKERLSPVLALEGYRRIMHQYYAEKINTPVIAIGGILKEDVMPLLQAGVYGVAVASSIGLAPHIRGAAVEFLETLKSMHYAATNSRQNF